MIFWTKGINILFHQKYRLENNNNFQILIFRRFRDNRRSQLRRFTAADKTVDVVGRRVGPTHTGASQHRHSNDAIDQRRSLFADGADRGTGRRGVVLLWRRRRLSREGARHRPSKWVVDVESARTHGKVNTKLKTKKITILNPSIPRNWSDIFCLHSFPSDWNLISDKNKSSFTNRCKKEKKKTFPKSKNECKSRFARKNKLSKKEKKMTKKL